VSARQLGQPVPVAGQKTGAFEIVDALGGAPDIHCLPVGNAGNVSAYWLGYSSTPPTGLRVHAADVGLPGRGAAPLVTGRPVPDPETIATAIRIGNPASWSLAVAAREESGGLIAAVTDEQILVAHKLLGARGGRVRRAGLRGRRRPGCCRL
jgi:threonine synthase